MNIFCNLLSALHQVCDIFWREFLLKLHLCLLSLFFLPPKISGDLRATPEFESRPEQYS